MRPRVARCKLRLKAAWIQICERAHIAQWTLQRATNALELGMRLTDFSTAVRSALCSYPSRVNKTANSSARRKKESGCIFFSLVNGSSNSCLRVHLAWHLQHVLNSCILRGVQAALAVPRGQGHQCVPRPHFYICSHI